MEYFPFFLIYDMMYADLHHLDEQKRPCNSAG